MVDYYADRDLLDDLYYGRRRPSSERVPLKILEPSQDSVQETKLPEKKIVRSIVREQEETIEPIRRISPNIIGTLFDRVNFLRTRIDETKNTALMREKLHKEMIKEIEEDIQEKIQMEIRASDVDEKRNFKLDISMLRKERRNEQVRFWKDMTELRTEMRELLERFETESKISKIFKGVE